MINSTSAFDKGNKLHIYPGHEVSFCLVTAHQHVAIIGWRWVTNCLLGDHYIHVFIIITLCPFPIFGSWAGRLYLRLGDAYDKLHDIFRQSRWNNSTIWHRSILGAWSGQRLLASGTWLLRAFILLLLWSFIPSILVAPFLSFLELLQFLLHVG